MEVRVVNIGFGNTVLTGRVVAVVSPESAPVKRVIQEAREGKCLIDATQGRRTKAVVVCDSGHIFLSALQTDTLVNRLTAKFPPAESVAAADPEAEK
ncbi:MAG: DUF370 domain-containing protein [Gracilibacteraceae bacterium]|jgi:regulator of extracellular matrix RemA (YlzA/DUF370 family)|nr:DUF370 domain-containing protein [Gracilibacteraceae bacterium]